MLEPDERRGRDAARLRGSAISRRRRRPAPATPFETVLAADTERAALLARGRDQPRSPPARRDPRAAERDRRRIPRPARAARILVGLGFDEDAQHRPLDSFSGGWRMRVALAALLFSAARPAAARRAFEPSRSRSGAVARGFPASPIRATILIVSHERDFLNNVVDHILHLERGKLTLYPGGYDAFETPACRAPGAARLGARQAAGRAREAAGLYRAQLAPAPRPPSRRSRAPRRWRGCSRSPSWSTIRSLSFDFPSPDELRPPLITLDMAAVGYGDKPVLQPAQPAARSRRPHRAARPQRQRQDHARPPARRAADADGGRDDRLGQDAGRLFHPISGRGARPRRYPARAYDAG